MSNSGSTSFYMGEQTALDDFGWSVLSYDLEQALNTTETTRARCINRWEPWDKVRARLLACSAAAVSCLHGALALQCRGRSALLAFPRSSAHPPEHHSPEELQGLSIGKPRCKLERIQPVLTGVHPSPSSLLRWPSPAFPAEYPCHRRMLAQLALVTAAANA